MIDRLVNIKNGEPPIKTNQLAHVVGQTQMFEYIPINDTVVGAGIL